MKLCAKFYGKDADGDDVGIPHQQIAFDKEEGCPMCRVLTSFLKISGPLHELANVVGTVSGLLFELGLHTGPDNKFAGKANV